MANGYIGKISALVTASTADLSRKLQGSTRDVNRFANSIQSQIATASRAAQSSLNGIFTPLQRIERALFAGRRLNLIDSSQVQQIQRAVSVAEGINKPLAAATRQFQGLSAEVQAQFLPALDLAQRRVAGLNDLLARSGSVSEKSFAVTANRIEQTAQAVQRLTQAQRAASAGFTGNELEFTNPRALEAINSAAAASQRAAALPATQREDPGIASRIRQLSQYRNLVAQTVAQVESLRLTPDFDPTTLEAAERRLNSIIETTRRAQQELDDITVRAGGGQTPDQRRAADNEIALLQRREQTAKQIEQQRLATAQRVADNEIALLQRREQAAKQAEQAAAAVARRAADNEIALLQRREQAAKQAEQAAAAAAQRAADNEIALLQRREQTAKEIEERRLASAQRAADNEIALIIRREQAAKRAAEQGIDSRTDLGGRLAEQGRRRVRGLTGDIDIDSTPRGPDGFSAQAQRDIDALGARVGAVRQQLETLPNSVRTRFVPELQRAQAELVRLQNSPRATVAEIERIRVSVARLEGQARTAGEALDFRERFGGGAGGFDRIFNTQALRGYTAQLDILQNLIGSVSAQARGPALVAFARLRDAIFRAFQAGTLGSEAAQREIAELTAEAVRASAAVAGVGAGGLQRRLNRAGDIGRRGLDRFSLAAQQAAFAIDDFFSVTGGLDQRIRAVGNNITQLGFVVGGTAGLFVTLGAVLTAQAVVGLVKWTRGGAAAEDISKALNERLEKQKRLLQEISSEFNDLAGSLADSAFSQAARQSQELEDRLDSLIKKIRELRENTASTLDPELFLLEGRRGTAERSLQGADSVALAAARQSRLRDVERRIQERQEVAERSRPISRVGLENVINASYGGGATEFRLDDAVDDRQILEILDRRQLELAQTVDSWFATFTSPFEQAEARRLIQIVDDARRRLEADIAEAIGQIVDGTFSDSVRRFEATTGRTAAALDRANEIGGPTNASRALQAAQEADAQRFRSVVRQFEEAVAEGRTEEARRAAVLLSRIVESAEARERETRAIVEAANASERFIALLRRFRELNDSILSDVSNAAEQARRDAVRAAGTSEAGLSRPDDAASAAARNERLQRELAIANDTRLGIESRIEEERRRFEQESPDPRVRQAVIDATRAQQLAESQTASDDARAQARQQAIRAEARLDQLFAASPIGQQLQQQIDAADQQAAIALERDSLIARGRELSQSEGQRAGRELGENIRAINAEFTDRVDRLRAEDPFADLAADLAGIEADRQAALARAREEAFRSAAPAIFALADQVANAVIQGPSRAALQATDVSTVEGSRELNRLLRGDDAARDQNLVELQKQSQSLDELVRIAREGGADIAN